MLESLSLKNLTAFANADFKFAQGINVMIGENGTGKTHILKMAYSAIYICANGLKESGSATPTKSHLQTEIASKLKDVFMPDELGRLARRGGRGKKSCDVGCIFSPAKDQLRFSFNTASKSEVAVSKLPSAWIDKLPVYLPTRELLTIYPGFLSLYATTHLPFEQTWRDTCLLLGAPLARGPREEQIKELLAPLETAMGGKVELDDAGRFYLNIAEGRMEMHLVAEGLRKFAMIARLIATGSLVDKGFLFWDEPEANLNPKIIKMIARTILHLCKSGIQVFVASHSLFLIRELDILLKGKEFSQIPSRFFGLQRNGNEVEVEQGDTADDIGPIDALQEELSQSDRYIESEAG
ncbi:MAG: AAA family ATPase [Candidatus Sumerlaeota bacterium]|nr:AAA family ATPase [Candidatus Sumerlaeota bacterium]